MKYFLILLAAALGYTDSMGQMRHFSIYVENKSDFDIVCEGKTEKGQGVFSKYTPRIKKHQYFVFVIASNKNVIPKGVEGTLRFRLEDPKYNGIVEAYFDNPIIGGPEFSLNAINYPFAAEQFPVSQIKTADVLVEKSVAIRLFVDTVKYNKPRKGLPVAGDDKVKPGGSDVFTQGLEEAIPEQITFEWEVQQRSRNEDEDDDDDDGKAYNDVTYYFTGTGSYAAIKPSDKGSNLMIYTPKGHTWMIDEKKKTILVMSMPRTVGEGGALGKEMAESIKKAPLKKDRDEDGFSMTRSGKTKKILGYTAEEYLLKSNKVNATKNNMPAASFWYATVPFDPVKIYTMGVGRPTDVSKLQNDARAKNNITAIPVLNKNYLMAETESGGIKGLETISITRRNFTFRTAGYTIKVAKSIRDMIGE